MWLLTLLLLSIHGPWVECHEDCEREYQDSIHTCHIIFDDPEDSGLLIRCIAGARGDYEGCMSNCDDDEDDEDDGC